MKKQLSAEDRKKKWENFWYYYKYYVLAGIFALFFIITFVKDMMGKIEYDYQIGVIGTQMLGEENMLALQEWFEKHAEDRNGDEEVHVQIADYSLPVEGEIGFDPQVYAANQTKLMVDFQEGDSMIYFMDKVNYDKLQEVEAFPALDETIEVKECNGFQDIGQPVYFQDMMVTMRWIHEDSKLGKDEKAQKYFDSCEKLLKEFVGE